MKSALLSSACTIFFAAAASQAKSDTVELCNAMPFSAWLSVAYEDSKYDDLMSRGWYNVSPGECRRFSDIAGKWFYLLWSSSQESAQYIYGRDNVSRTGFNFFCYDPKKAFEVSASASCANKAGYAALRLGSNSDHRYSIKAKNHDHLTVATARLAEYAINGRIAFEKFLHAQTGREPPFSLGIKFEEVADGILVTQVFPGMPAEEEGVQVGDIITSLDGEKIHSGRDFFQILDAISLFRETPLNISVRRREKQLNGVILPMFFAFNHRDYREQGKVGAFVWETLDGGAFGFGNEFGCGLLAAGFEGFRSLGRGTGYDWSGVAEDTSSCSKQLNRKHEKQRILYDSATKAGFWASLLLPSIPVAKLFKSQKGLRLSQRSRHVAPSHYGKGSLK